MLKVLSLFSGIGAFEVALNELEIDWKLDHYCEIDKYASQSYNCIHGTTDEDNLKDVTNIDYSKIGDIDLVTYGFPCQDISLAGNQKGFFDEDGNLTRSGLFFNAADVIRHTNPKFAIFENVKNLTGKKFKAEFETVLSTLDELGYNTYWKVLNAKDYGIPQNRERVFGISIRKDIDDGFDFPNGFELTKKLKDVLESNVDDKYYLSDKAIMGRLHTNFNQYKLERNCINDKDVHPTILARYEGSPTLYKEFVEVKEATKKGYAEAYEGDSINLDQPNSKTRRGRVGKQVAQTLTTSCNQGVVEPLICASRGRNPDNPSSRKIGDPTEQRIEINKNGVSNTLTTVQKDNLVIEPNFEEMLKGTNYARNFGSKGKVCKEDEICGTLQAAMGSGGGNIPLTYNNFRIRKLTPRECWRLMGFKDKYFDRVKGVSNTQLYKQAGNSIVVDVLKYIFEELHNQYPEYFSKDEWGSDL